MSTPPNMPPGGGQPPIPPYDTKAQWKAYREQQKAAWRAQRDAWKAQQRAMKAGYAGPYVPRVPSFVGPILLIGVGVIALLVMTGHIAADQFWDWSWHWWPMLLICAGLLMLGEWALDMRRGIPVRRGGGYVGILILLVVLFFVAAAIHHVRPWLQQNGNNDFGFNFDDNFFNSLGQPEHDFDAQALHAQIPANASIEIQDPRGDVSVTAGDGSTIEVLAHEVAYASADAEAKKIFDAEAAHLTVNGSSVLVKSESNDHGKLNLTITVPKSAHVTINSGKGDVTAAGIGNGINFTAHGDVHLSGIAGSVEAHFPNGKHDFSVHDLQGNLTVDGNVDDVTLSEIKGKVTQMGEILGDVHMENISGPTHLHTSVTDLQVAELPGDLTLDSDDLHVNEAKGQVRVVTHSKDIDISQVYGDSYVEDRDGRIAVEPAGNYAIDARNSKGDVEVTLEPNASASIDARTRNGEIMTEYGLKVNGEESKTVTGKIGSGSAKITLSTDVGDVSIKKGTAFPATPSLPKADVPPYPKTPDLSNAPKLKSSKTLPAEPVTQ
ncbi:MAG: DUF4097 family beta strand repeat-containing protein [Terracidiphilus sp.]